MRHKYLAAKLDKENSIDLLKVFIEKNSKTKTSQFKSKLLKKYLIKRKKYEKFFFKKFVDINYNKNLENQIVEGSINSAKFLKEIKKMNPDLIISFGCSIIKGDILKVYKNKFINIHLGLTPYMRGAGTNIFPFYLKRLELVGSTIMFINKKVDAGRIIHHTTPNFTKSDNIHTIGFKLIKKTISELIKILSSNKKLKSKAIKKTTELYFRRKDFNSYILNEVEKNISSGIISDYLKKNKKIKLINFFEK